MLHSAVGKTLATDGVVAWRQAAPVRLQLIVVGRAFAAVVGVVSAAIDCLFAAAVVVASSQQPEHQLRCSTKEHNLKSFN